MNKPILEHIKPKVALSIKQPWAWLIVNGWKDVENRTWSTKFRGWIYIHAGKSFDMDGYDWVRENFPYIRMPLPSEFDVGGVVGMAHLFGCVEESESRWFMGDYGFLMHDPRPLPFTPLRGQLGIFPCEVNCGI